MPGKIDPAVKERALRMIADHRQDYPSDTALAEAVAGKLNIGRETVRRWLVQADINAGSRPGTSSDEQAELKRLKAENKRLREDNEILRAATVFFAARTYRAWKQPNRLVAGRTRSDAQVIDKLLGVQGTPEGLYGRRKMTHYLRRQGLPVAFCTIDRLMRDLGMNGVRRGKGVRTTVPAKDEDRAGDLVNRDFTAPAPNIRWVADFTHCRTWAGFCYVAFVLDVFSQRIVGWHAAADRRTDLVMIPLRIALWDRDRQGRPVKPGQLLHHSDAGSQYTSIRFTEHLRMEGIAPSIGTVGDAYDCEDVGCRQAA